MTYARKTLVSLTDTPYYHVVARWGSSITCSCMRRRWDSLGCEGCARRSCSIGDRVSAILSTTSRSLLVS